MDIYPVTGNLSFVDAQTSGIFQIFARANYETEPQKIFAVILSTSTVGANVNATANIARIIIPAHDDPIGFAVFNLTTTVAPAAQLVSIAVNRGGRALGQSNIPVNITGTTILTLPPFVI